MNTLQESVELALVKSLTGEAGLEKAASWSGDNYKKSPEATVLAGCHALLTENGRELDEVIKVASVYGVTEKIRDFGEKLIQFQDQEKQANFALGGNKFPIATKEQLLESDTHFHNTHMNLPHEWRTKIASNLKKKSLDFGIVKLSAATEVYNDATCLANLNLEVPSLCELVTKRASLAKDQLAADMYLAAEKALRLSATSPDTLIKTAHIIEKIDRYNGTFPYKHGTNGKFEAPIVELVKCAAVKADPIVEIMGSNFKASTLAQLPKEIYQQALGDDVLSSISVGGKPNAKKISVVIPTLPLGDKQILSSYIEDHTRGSGV